MWYAIIIFDIVNELIVRMGLDNKSEIKIINQYASILIQFGIYTGKLAVMCGFLFAK